jgi:hypothetical protein
MGAGTPTTFNLETMSPDQKAFYNYLISSINPMLAGTKLGEGYGGPGSYNPMKWGFGPGQETGEKTVREIPEKDGVRIIPVERPGQTDGVGGGVGGGGGKGGSIRLSDMLTKPFAQPFTQGITGNYPTPGNVKTAGQPMLGQRNILSQFLGKMGGQGMAPATTPTTPASTTAPTMEVATPGMAPTAAPTEEEVLARFGYPVGGYGAESQKYISGVYDPTKTEALRNLESSQQKMATQFGHRGGYFGGAHAIGQGEMATGTQNALSQLLGGMQQQAYKEDIGLKTSAYDKAYQDWVRARSETMAPLNLLPTMLGKQTMENVVQPGTNWLGK